MCYEKYDKSEPKVIYKGWVNYYILHLHSKHIRVVNNLWEEGLHRWGPTPGARDEFNGS